jgi:hypothetical protein
MPVAPVGVKFRVSSFQFQPVTRNAIAARLHETRLRRSENNFVCVRLRLNYPPLADATRNP